MAPPMECWAMNRLCCLALVACSEGNPMGEMRKKNSSLDGEELIGFIPKWMVSDNNDISVGEEVCRAAT